MENLKIGYTTGISPEDVAKYCILVGDPARVYRFANQFDVIECEKKNREYVTITGMYRNIRLTVMGTGMGGASTEMAIVELSQCRSDLTFIRCGSCGGLNQNTRLGDLIISTAALRYENTSADYADPMIPAVAHNDVFLALLHAAVESGFPYHAGLTATMPSFYSGQGRDVPPFQRRNQDIVERLAAQKVINMEMEASTLLTLAHLAGHRAGVICAVFAERMTNQFIKSPEMEQAEDRCISVVLASVKHLKKMDDEKGTHGYWQPGFKLTTQEKELLV